MKSLLFLCCICMGCLNLQAQNKRDTLFIYAGIASRTDEIVGLELDLKYIQKNDLLSGGLRFAVFNYEAMAGSVEIMSDLSSIKNHVSYEYNISGFCIKPGWIPLKVLKPKFLTSLGIYGVLSHSAHDFAFEYSDVAGTTFETYSRKTWNYGLEADWHFGVRFFKRMNLGASYIFGIRQKNVDVFGDVVPGMNSFKYYTPVQGSSPGPIYVNFLITLGLNF